MKALVCGSRNVGAINRYQTKTKCSTVAKFRQPMLTSRSYTIPSHLSCLSTGAVRGRGDTGYYFAGDAASIPCLSKALFLQISVGV